MILLHGETLASISVSKETDQCWLCRQPAIRTITINGKDNSLGEAAARTVTLCKEHFIEACIAHPALRLLEEERRAS